ncbi:ParA family protein [Pseudomonas sp. HY7a-MNA-CIBAN-0227]|uniref:ParA family protein n=1 Tax=Pseudomonas sp. HY7a-MNA-CIBAN-0227 TaxID=3140474 RepID=UPI00331DEF25
MNHEVSSLTLAVNKAIRQEAKVLVFGGIKGGSGKTVGCQTAATALVDLGYTVLYVDLDQQKTGVYWWNRRVDFITDVLAELESRRGTIEDMLLAVNSMEGLAKYQLQKDIEKYYKYEKMMNLTAVGLTPQVDGWAAFVELISEECENYDYIIIDTPGHLDNASLQENVFGIADLVIFPTKTTMVDLEQMPTNKELTLNIREKYNANFKAVALPLVKDKTGNKYNDYSVLNEVKDTLPVLNLDGVDAVLALKTIGLKANEIGCTAIEYGNDKEEKESIRRFGRAIVATINNESVGV